MSILEIFIIVTIIGIVVFFQIKSAIKVRNNIERLKDLNLHDACFVKGYVLRNVKDDFDYDRVFEFVFNQTEEEKEQYLVNENYTEVVLIYHDSVFDEVTKIVRELNTYILKNIDSSINFNIIKDITDRNYQVLDDNINQSLPTPMYFGLAATMSGIIIGLLFTDLKSGDFSIIPLIQGVGIAMVASLFGVLLTTYLSNFKYQKGKKEAEEEKNAFFSMLQADLLPDLIRNGESSNEILVNRLGDFSKVANKFTKDLNTVALQMMKVTNEQSNLIERVDRLDLEKSASFSLDVLDRIERNLESFDRFSNYYEKLSSSLEVTNDLVSNLRILVSQFQNVESISDSIKKTLIDYNSVMSFFNDHIDSLNNLDNFSKNAVAEADIAFKKAIEELKHKMVREIQMVEGQSASFSVELKKIGETVAKELAIATKQHVEKLTSTYTRNLPEFQKLNELDKLNELEKLNLIVRNTEEATQVQIKSDDLLLERFSRLESAINSLKESRQEKSAVHGASLGKMEDVSGNSNSQRELTLLEKLSHIIVILFVVFAIVVVSYLFFIGYFHVAVSTNVDPNVVENLSVDLDPVVVDTLSKNLGPDIIDTLSVK